MDVDLAVAGSAFADQHLGPSGEVQDGVAEGGVASVGEPPAIQPGSVAKAQVKAGVVFDGHRLEFEIADP